MYQMTSRYIALFIGLLVMLDLNIVVASEGVHLFILSGQSNMVRLNPDISFIPAVTKELGKDKILTVKDAYGGQSIRRWYKQWKRTKDKELNTDGDLYTHLINKVKLAIKGKVITSVTLIWMQGERDAAEGYGKRYAESFKGLLKQFSTDLHRHDINFVIGRISDFDMTNTIYKHWTKIRKIQVMLAKSDIRGSWVNTDDLNDGLNKNGIMLKDDLHYSSEGYFILGNRFAEKAIELIKIDTQGVLE